MVLIALRHKVHSVIGAALIAAPSIGALVMGRAGHPKYTALLASVISVAHFAYMYGAIEETAPGLAGRSREESSGAGPEAVSAPTPASSNSSPLSFLEYFKISGPVAGLMTAFLLHSLPVEMHDMRMTLTRTVLGFTDTQTAQMLTFLGIGTLCGGFVRRPLKLGIQCYHPNKHFLFVSCRLHKSL